MMTSGVYRQRTLSIASAEEQLMHFRGWVWSAVRLVAQRIAGQPVCVGKGKASRRRYKSLGEKIEPLESHPLLDGLSDPNDLQTFWQLQFSSIASLELTGRAVVGVKGLTRDTARPHDADSAHSHALDRVGHADAGQVGDPSAEQAQDFTIPGDEILHLHYPNPADPRDVISPLARIAEAVLTDQSIQTAQHSAFHNGIHPKIILTAGRHPDQPGIPGSRPVLTPDQREEITAMIKHYYSVRRPQTSRSSSTV